MAAFVELFTIVAIIFMVMGYRRVPALGAAIGRLLRKEPRTSDDC